ncbi:hypothetical protein [Bacillus thuringiensis]|uniref:hypothetical protein n=2 Tax=Bacillus cereus group TaxID=86661 RepID=UPI00207AEDC8|nr:hypothetical protein [Bacillus thuringiensis]USL16559.1 hypothetical protein LIT28_27765 [Bacillus thuringiensis]
MKIIKKVAVISNKEFSNYLLEMNNRESDVADLMVPYYYYYFLFKRKVLWLVRGTGTRIINLYNYENEEDKKVAFEILEFYIHQNCSVIYSVIDGRVKKINNNRAYKLLEIVKISKNLIC